MCLYKISRKDKFLSVMATHTDQLSKSLKLVNELSEKYDITDEDVIQDMYLIAIEGDHNRNTTEEIYKNLISYMEKSEDLGDSKQVPFNKVDISVKYSVDDMILLKELHNKLDAIITSRLTDDVKESCMKEALNDDEPDTMSDRFLWDVIVHKASWVLGHSVEAQPLKEFLSCDFSNICIRVTVVHN